MVMARLKSYRELDVWKKSIEFAGLVYGISKEFPPEERFGITSQVRRAASSIPANIAEGAGRHGAREFFHFLSIASGSFAETETYLILAVRLGIARAEEVEDLLSKAEVLGRMISGLKRSLRSKTCPRPIATYSRY